MIINPVLKVQNEGSSVDYSNGTSFTEVFGEIFDFKRTVFFIEVELTKWAGRIEYVN